jgi:flagellar motor switch protein FliG
MSVYARFKREKDGLRHLVELLEVTPSDRRKRMIDVGMKEDPDYTKLAMSFMMTFSDILEFSDLELAELINQTPGRVTGLAISLSPEEVKVRFLKNSQIKRIGEIREAMEIASSPSTVAGAQLRLVGFARELERKGKVRVKKIPLT